jgi:hypothetical protein
VERLPQSIQADVFHLFSVGEGIAYGSSTMNYLISGAPISAFRVELSDEYFNVEFTGKDVRNWQKTTNGYLVQLHTPVSGTYTLLATCERPFKAQGDTLTFTGARPLDAQSEQGHTLVISAYQFQVRPVNVSPGLLPLETAEVPAEYRLFFDAPVLAAYRYATRPFNLQLALSPLVQGETLSLVVDRAALTTRISKDGEVVTDVRYFVKNRGNPHFRLTLPEGTTLWSATVNGATVVPVKDGVANLIPLPQRADPNAVQTLDLKLASRSKNPARVTAAAPIVTMPVLLAEWKVEPDTGQRLIYRGGSLAPASGIADASGFVGLARIIRGQTLVSLLLALGLVAFAVWAWRWATREATHRFSFRHLSGALIGVAAVALAGLLFVALWNAASQEKQFPSRGLAFLAPVQQSGSALMVEVSNVPDQRSFWTALARAWPALLALLVWGYTFVRLPDGLRPLGIALGWTLLAWATLRWPNGAGLFFIQLMVFLFVQVLLPALRPLFQLPRKPAGSGGSAAAPVTAALMLSGILWVSMGSIVAAPVEQVTFPLTPALSPAERENGSPRLEHAKPINGQDASATDHSKGGDEGELVGISKTVPNELPLRGGEGWGEGEGTVRPSNRFHPANTATQNAVESKPILHAFAGRNVTFPLTPALSPAERENDSPGLEPTKAANGHDALPPEGKVMRLAQVAKNSEKTPRTSTSPVTPLARTKEPAFAESVLQEITVKDQFVAATARIRWHAIREQMLPLLFEPAVLTRISYPTTSLKLVQTSAGGKRRHQLLAQQDGSFDIELEYQLHVTKKDGESGFALPTQHGLVNRVTLTLPDLDVDVSAENAVSVARDAATTNTTIATLVLAPVPNPWISWKPRSRDVKREKPVFFVELFQLYAPAAGVIEGVHQVQVRPAQGEMGELVFDVPAGATITDVLDPSRITPTNEPGKPSLKTSLISLWRFDPDTRKLRVTLNPPQSRPFTLIVRSQIATGPLPFEQTAGLLSVNAAANQLGSVGIATGSEVQLDTVSADAFSSINLEDFPAAVLQPLRAQIAGLTLRRAFRYADAKGTVALKASPVEPDVRVETQETLSVGEDRTLLAVNASLLVTRAGIFRVSFVLPTGLDVESISGTALSHWTELRAPEGRVITLHLKGKTQGEQQFSVSLAGPGTKAATGVAVPRLLFREASKQRGQLVIVPEQGMRLQVATRDGVTQLDPQKTGIRQKGVLAFRLLQPQWTLTLDVEQVDAWVQVTSLQHVTVNEAQVKIAANFQYQIENTGLKALRVLIPTNAESVRFRGEQVSDFMPVAGQVTNALQAWEVKLHRRIIGKYLLQATWQTPLAGAATNASVRGAQALDANLQRGFVTVQSSGRLQVRADAAPATLQPAEWQSIPRLLLRDIPATTANYTFRLVESDYQLPLYLERHEATKLLPAHVNAVNLTSVISDEGVMLTQVTLDLVPGDKQLLNFTLPAEARFWFAFVNQNGVWPWRDQDRILIPLEQQSRADKPTSVELFYSSRIGSPGRRTLDLELLGPKFDLPLENITWRVYLNGKWKLADWKGTLQFQDDSIVSQPAAVNVQSYLEREVSLNREKTKAAEEMLQQGNTLLEHGNPQQARRAFQSAFGLSTHDDAFNEDARVQLHNLKLQQALVGLNVRQSAAAGESAPAPGNLKDLRNRKDVAYTQQEAKEIIDGNTADDNAALLRLAERIIQQQDAALPNPTAIRAAIPQQGRLLTFRRTVQVDTFADLKISLETTAARAAGYAFRLVTLGLVFIGFVLLIWATNQRRGHQNGW